MMSKFFNDEAANFLNDSGVEYSQIKNFLCFIRGIHS